MSQSGGLAQGLAWYFLNTWKEVPTRCTVSVRDHEIHMIEMQCVVTGRVQGVAFRAYAQDAADELGVTGWVKNAADGSVLLCAQGTPDLLKEYVEYLHEGSLRAEVEGVAVEWATARELFTEFSIKHD